MSRLSHADAQGRVRMVDVGDKRVTAREAVARGAIRVSAAARRAVRRGAAKKGDPLQAARIAGIMAAKRTHELIPLCHPLNLSTVVVNLEPSETPAGVRITAEVKTTGPTGVEMEALTAAAGAGLAIYDMVKAIDRGMRLTDLCLVEKSGGRSGHWVRR